MSAEESFIVSARKYRPASWHEVIGQDAITETLQKSIEQDHLAHAYLFCGPRGVGKTTCARIFAKEINLSEEHTEDEDFSFNIFELDAASNNSVNDIRSLTDQVRIPPQIGEYKVYIIDEVHMLSTQAFNAFLKTLEEPPKHAIFILATTEKHKIIPTILSRCQIYDFNRIGVEEIVKHLTVICEKESVEFEEEALHVIGQKADGALRDALSIFDQLSSFTNGKLTYQDVLKNLHVLDYDYYFKTVDHLFAQEYAEALVVLDDILKQGFDGGHFLNGLGSHLRDLLVCKDPKTLSLLEVGDSVKKRYHEQSQKVDAAWIIEALKEINQGSFKFKASTNQRLLLEVSLLSLASLGLEKKKLIERPILQASKPPPSKKEVIEKPQLDERVSEVELEKPSPEVAVESNEKAKDPEPEAIAADQSTDAPSVQSEEPAVVEEPAPEPIRPSASTNKKKTRLVSLRIDAGDEDSSTTSMSEEVKRVIDREGISLERAWSDVCERLKEQRRSTLHSIMTKNASNIVEADKEIRVALAHEVDEEEFSTFKTDLLFELRQLTNNPELELRTYREEIKLDTKLFHSKEKFEHLAKKNPSLNKLKKDFDLDISF